MKEEALVRAVRVVRGSWNSKGVSVGIFTAKGAKYANKKGSVLCRSEAVQGRVQGEVSPPLKRGDREP